AKLRIERKTEIQSFDVLIVGAGIAGLSAAEYLVKNEIKNVAVLEAKQRIGGRIYTRFVNGNPLEMGAQWIHGAEIVNNVFNLAVQNRLINDEPCETLYGPALLPGGKFVNTHLVNQLFKEMENIEKVKRDDSLEMEMEKEFETIAENFATKDRDVLKKVFNFYKIQKMFDEGDELNKITSKSDYLAYPCDLDITGGLNRLVDAIAFNIEELRILKNHQVLNIDYSESNILVKVKTGDEIKYFKANFVICTVSLGFLKENSASLFTPRLPERKLTAVNRLVFGRGVKIFLFYSNPFWKKNNLLKLKLGLSDEDYAKGYNDWVYRVGYFEEVVDCPNVLLTTVFGDVAKEVEPMNEFEINKKLTNLLRNYTSDYTLPKADQIIKSEWITDEFVLGTYSAPGIDSDAGDFDIIGESLPDSESPRLLFAGEATSRTHYSTMHGARESGVREAMRIVDQIQRDYWKC
ncbi:peroxisomal N(1)-acetyl-spermine/spermidine oxidase-like protein, partial [Dinothrombium tinctorium]